MTESENNPALPSIALVTPCAEEDVVFVSSLLRSVNYQTRLPTEMIISVSGIDSGTARNLEQRWLSELDERVPMLVLDTTEKLYAGPNRQRGADITRSEVVSFFDVDDVQAPDRLEKIAGAFVDPSVKAAFHRFTIQNVRNFPPANEDAWFDGAPNMYHRGWISVRRDVVRKIAWGNEPRAQEFAYLDKLVRAYGKEVIAFLPDVLGHYVATGYQQQNQYLEYKTSCLESKLAEFADTASAVHKEPDS